MLKTFLSLVMFLAPAPRRPAPSAAPRQPTDKGDNAAARLEDRLQRVAALAAVYRGDAERLSKKAGGARRPSAPVP